MNVTPVRSIRKFNPGTFQSDEEIIEQFVVRQHTLRSVLEVVSGNIDSPSCQHVLIVAPRGRGKSMLLARVVAELRTDNELSTHLLPVQFMEENLEIFDMADFWIETLFHLARECETQDPQFAKELRASHAALTVHWRDQTVEDQARAVILDAADRLGKKLVLMVENLQSLCESVNDDFGWKLRGVLQSEPQIMLLASATSRFEGLDDANQPFFELFRIVGLEALNTGECSRLWQVVSGDAVSDREIRALQILTGGSPRLLVIVAGFARHRSLLKLMEELVELIDEHTEYFRGHLEALGKTERRVYVAVIDLWQPSKPGEIAARARMDVRTVSTMLGRLVNRGAVLVEGGGKKRMYSATERLYSIYYKLRRERDEAAVVRNLIHFMAVFYSEAELTEMSSRLIAEAARSPVIREGIQRATAEIPQVASVFAGMAQLGNQKPFYWNPSSDNSGAELFLREIAAAFDEGAFEKVIEVVDQAFAPEGVDWSRVSKPLIARALYSRAVAHMRLNNYEAAVTAHDEMIERYGASEVPALRAIVARSLLDRGFARGALGDLEAVTAANDEMIARYGASDVPEVQAVVAGALFHAGFGRALEGDSAAALAVWDEVAERYGASQAPEVQATVARALVLTALKRGELGDLEAEIAAWSKVIDRYRTSEVPDLQGIVALAMQHKGSRLAKVGRAEEALRLCDELESRIETLDDLLKFPVEWGARQVRTKAHLLQENRPAAVETFRSAYAAYVPGNEPMMDKILETVADLVEFGVPEHDLVEILSSDKAKSDTLTPLVVALLQRIGQEVRAPTEVLEVAADVRKRIEARLAKSAPASS